MNLKEIQAGLIIFFIVFTGIIIYLIDASMLSPRCSEYKSHKRKHLSGIVIDKYRDASNHRFPAVEIRNKLTGKKYKEYIIFDTSGFYEYLHKGDSVYKEEGSMKVKVFRNEILKVFQLDYGCYE